MDDAKGSKPGTDEGRDHLRQPIELEVEYTRLNSFFSDYTRNISKGGTFIKTSKPLDVGTEFMFKLRIPKMSEALEIIGRVQWIATPEDVAAGNDHGRGEPGMGIRFIFQTPEERDALEQKVERVMIDSLGQLLYTKLMEHSRRQGEGVRHTSSITGKHRLPTMPGTNHE
jgi:type IV pilus assembly protein PilZ